MFGLGRSTTDAIALLSADHRHVVALFAKLDGESSADGKANLATEICNELLVHAKAEEDIFYPEVMASLKEEESTPIWEAAVEHGVLAGLIQALTGMEGNDPGFDGHMNVLREYVEHHVREEEREIFPAARCSNLDLEELGTRLAERKRVLQRERGLDAGFPRERP